jgi:hypothetical protein
LDQDDGGGKISRKGGQHLGQRPQAAGRSSKSYDVKGAVVSARWIARVVVCGNTLLPYFWLRQMIDHACIGQTKRGAAVPDFVVTA